MPAPRMVRYESAFGGLECEHPPDSYFSVLSSECTTSCLHRCIVAAL